MVFKVRNVVIYMSDTLRWDYTPSCLLKLGASFKTVAAGNATFLSVPSMLTGLYPHQHGVLSFRHILPSDIPSLLNLEGGFRTGFYNFGGFKDGVDFILNEPQTRLEDLEPPFIYFERDAGGHIPYDGAGYTGSLSEFILEFSGRTDKIRRWYKASIDQSVKRFWERLEFLKHKNLLDETLLVFVSDHGELLGEYGLVGHSFPLCPQHIYVPTVMIHPAIKPGPRRGIIGHIDLFPTVLSLLEREVPAECEGVNIFQEKVRFRVTFSIQAAYARIWQFFFHEKTPVVWQSFAVSDEVGGHIINAMPFWKRFLMFLKVMQGFRKGWESLHLWRNPRSLPEALKMYLANYNSFGLSKISKKEAGDIVNRIRLAPQRQAIIEDLDEEHEITERLRDLGYL